MKKIEKLAISLVLFIIIGAFIYAAMMIIKPSLSSHSPLTSQSESHYEVQNVPLDKDYIEINHNIPYFSNDDIQHTTSWVTYGKLDRLGRVTQANALLGTDLMPAKSRSRETLESVTPTGWHQKRYSNIVNGGWLYNRSHLIGYQLAGENANPLNLMTGTRWFNAEGMLPFENYVANYIEKTENHVRYRITPVFAGNELLARGLYMEGFSIEDNGNTKQGGLCFNIYIPNRQPGIEIDYMTGKSKLK